MHLHTHSKCLCAGKIGHPGISENGVLDCLNGELDRSDPYNPKKYGGGPLTSKKKPITRFGGDGEAIATPSATSTAPAPPAAAAAPVPTKPAPLVFDTSKKRACSSSIVSWPCPIGETCEQGFCEPRTSCGFGRFCPHGMHCSAYFGSGQCMRD